uniref:G protein-coupled receptor n=1 Tax=Romanomermis culicivorax TaxID=13658 RepID=A0A915I2S2_ROMCU
MKTNIISNGKFIGYDDTHLFFLVFPLLPTIATACFTWNEMISIYSCWLNYDNDVALCTTLILIGGFSALTFVMIEDANIKFYSPLPLTAKNQRFIARINIGTLWLRTILHFSSWLSTSFAIYVQRFALFPTAFAINVSLGVVIFVSHVGGNMKSWNAVAQAKRMVQRKRVAHVQIFEL